MLQRLEKRFSILLNLWFSWLIYSIQLMFQCNLTSSSSMVLRSRSSDTIFLFQIHLNWVVSVIFLNFWRIIVKTVYCSRGATVLRNYCGQILLMYSSWWVTNLLLMASSVMFFLLVELISCWPFRLYSSRSLSWSKKVNSSRLYSFTVSLSNVSLKDGSNKSRIWYLFYVIFCLIKR